MIKLERVPVREQEVKIRVTNFNEVNLGYDEEEAVREADRCLQCKVPKCVAKCPVNNKIPSFIKSIKERNFKEAADIIATANSLPSVCGRVCPHELQCEGGCVMGIKGESVAIGRLERFVGDWSIRNGIEFERPEVILDKKVAVVGSGPAGLACAGDLAKAGYQVTIFEALHEFGGVLAWGIPEFILPKETVVNNEIEKLKKLGVKFEKNVMIGKTITIDELLEEEGFEAVFIGTGAAMPSFMGIPGEAFNGVVSANEFLTKNNLMRDYKADYKTPLIVGKKVVVVGGGNVAMDAVRTLLRVGAEAHMVYRRSEAELPARKEEIEYAKEEGVHFHLLTNPTEIVADENKWVSGVRCIKMELGEPDQSGRRSPVPVEGSEFVLDADMVIMAIGTKAGSLIGDTTKGLETNRWNLVVIDEETGRTSREFVYAGGDVVTGPATVIKAMGAGRKAAKAIIEDLSK
ncbi:NADPH-dependent glutamate synthase [Clostridium fungisolvens]|uniref:Glutamate synthase [NADPH] small chain n=1 Tax=Clostridium fungisolvens TaxID=1604897 RepID=A0A6V8SC60_9CLOT|nr:NADPH-dependent glutamate synthase [Clostridium fungisolvens]GFP74829.1 Glutamate synthase [NADPH] small chain [Clostridium fungisolvens]